VRPRANEARLRRISLGEAQRTSFLPVGGFGRDYKEDMEDIMQEVPEARTNRATGEWGTLTGLCIECALRRHDFHEVIGNNTKTPGPPDITLPQALIDGRRHVLLSYVWTHQERCSECERKAPNLYLAMR
jgi:hypothetical protein